MNSADTFEDILEKLGADSHAYSSVACFVLLLIIIALISALCWGSCSRQSNAGSNCLIIAIILIFCVFTFITLMGLFYYVLGMVTYEAVCRRLGELGDYESKSVRPVDRIAACKPDQHVYDLLAEYKLYDVERIMSNNSGEAIDVDDVRWSEWKGDLSGFKILTLDEMTLLNKTVFELYPYTGALYTKNVCKTLRSPSTEISFEWRNFLHSKVYSKPPGCHEELYEVCTNGNKIMTDARKAERQEPDILRCIDAIEETTTKIDALITGKGFTFGETISKLLDKVEKCEKFLEKRGLDYINTIGRNLTESLKMQFEKYRVYTQSRIQDSVGPCGPLIYHLDRGTKAACRQLIDPINGFWMGLLMSSLLFLPLLYVAHSLICLYRPHRVKSTFVHLNRSEGCPTCTGHPYVPPPTVICSGAQERDWDAIDIETVDSKSKID